MIPPISRLAKAWQLLEAAVESQWYIHFLRPLDKIAKTTTNQ